MSKTEENDREEHGQDKKFTIIVNGREKVVTKKELSFTEIVALSSLPSGPNIVFTITYRKGEGHKPEGSLVDRAIAL